MALGASHADRAESGDRSVFKGIINGFLTRNTSAWLQVAYAFYGE